MSGTPDLIPSQMGDSASRCFSGACAVQSIMPRFPRTRKVLCLWNLEYYRQRALSMNSIQMSGCRCSPVYSYICSIHLDFLPVQRSRMGTKWHVRSRADGTEPDSSMSTSSRSTRLVRVIQSFLIRLRIRIKEFRKGLPMKVLVFLVGFYCATAFATVIGQTGDWDILSAGLAVVLVEGIGALTYKASFSFVERLKSGITIFNYWKAGLSLGLFLDAFKYEIDFKFLEDCNPFNYEFDFFPFFW